MQWVAHRPATGQTFEAVVAPRRPLSPSTPAHVELTVTRLRGGGTLADWRAAWSRFTRPHDILVVWGTFYRNLAAAEGLPLASSTIDLRDEAAKALRRRVGSLDTCSELFGTLPERLGCDGRGGRRLDALVDALAFFRLASPKDTP